jgi:hypothetical protein
VLGTLVLFPDQRSGQFAPNSQSSAGCRPRAGSAAATMSLLLARLSLRLGAS